MRCRTARLALRCCAVLRCAFVRTYRSTRCHAIPGTERLYARLYWSFIRFLHLGVLSRSSFFFENYTHTGDQNVTSPASTHSTAQATGSAYKAALGIIKSLDAPNHGPLLSAAFTSSCILPCASVLGGVSRPRSGALIATSNYFPARPAFSSCHRKISRCFPFQTAERAHVLETEILREFPPERRCVLHVETWIILFCFVCQSHLSSAQHRSASSQSSAVRCRARPCGAVSCGAVPCCAVPCCVVLRALMYQLFRTRQVPFDEVTYSSIEVPHTRFVCTIM